MNMVVSSHEYMHKITSSENH